MILRNRIYELLRDEGSMQVIAIKNMLNDGLSESSDDYVTRNTVSTTIYNNLGKGEKLFVKVGYGRFDIIDRSKYNNKLLDKLVNLMINYQKEFRKLGINYDTRKFNISFTDNEIEYITKLIRKNKK